MIKTDFTEELSYITSDGIKHILHDPPKRTVLENTGWGMPVYALGSTKGPYQHGSTPISTRLEDRVVTVTIRHHECSRSKYWGIRSTLIDKLRPNRSSMNDPEPGILRWVYWKDNQRIIRHLNVFINSGPVFPTPGQGQWDEFSVQEQLIFKALDPVIYDPTVKTVTVGSSTSVLQLPVTFPFVLGAYAYNFTVNYLGNFESYPTITLAGTINKFTIINNSTGKRISLDYDVSIGETVTINLGYGSKTITNNFDQGLLGYLTQNSDLGVFNLEGDPLVTGGVNSLTVYTDTGTTNGTITLTYYNRYIGI